MNKIIFIIILLSFSNNVQAGISYLKNKNQETSLVQMLENKELPYIEITNEIKEPKQESIFEVYDRKISESPSNSFLYLARASAKASFGDYKGALEDYNKTIELNSEFMFAYINRSFIKL